MPLHPDDTRTGGRAAKLIVDQRLRRNRPSVTCRQMSGDPLRLACALPAIALPKGDATLKMCRKFADPFGTTSVAAAPDAPLLSKGRLPPPAAEPCGQSCGNQRLRRDHRACPTFNPATGSAQGGIGATRAGPRPTTPDPCTFRLKKVR